MTTGSFGYAAFTGNLAEMHEFMAIAEIKDGPMQDRMNSLYNGYIRLQREERLRNEKEEKIKNLKVGDRVTLVGLGRHRRSIRSMWDSAMCSSSGEKVKFVITAILKDYPCNRISFELNGYTYEFPVSAIVEVFPAPVRKVRGKDRRIERQDVVVSGSNLHLVKTLEDVAKNSLSGLTEDQLEVLKDAQSKIRKDGTANGRRAGVDRRKSW